MPKYNVKKVRITTPDGKTSIERYAMKKIRDRMERDGYKVEEI